MTHPFKLFRLPSLKKRCPLWTILIDGFNYHGHISYFSLVCEKYASLKIRTCFSFLARRMQISLLVKRFPERCWVLSLIVLTTFLQSSVYLYNFHFRRPKISVAFHCFPTTRFDIKILVTSPWQQSFSSPVLLSGIFTFLVHFSKSSLSLIILCKIFAQPHSLIM